MTPINLTPLKKIIHDEMMQKAQPWEPITEHYLTTEEFLGILGIKKSSGRYRAVLKAFCLACSRTDGQSLMPDHLKRIFLNGIVRVHLFEYKQKKSPVKFVYRIAVQDINEEYMPEVQKVMDFRNEVKTPGAIDVYPRTMKKLKYLSLKTRTSISDLIEKLVNKEVNSLG